VREDADGALHTFKFRSLLVPTGLEIEAIEITETCEMGTGSRCSVISKRTPGNCFSRCVQNAVESRLATCTTRSLAGNSPRTSGTSDER
jgi:hypothetical protein